MNNRSRVATIAVGSLISMMFTLAGLAVGDTGSVTDPSDDSGATLEITEVLHGHAFPPRNEEVTHTIVMNDEWSSDLLASHSMGICFDLDGDADRERCLFVKRNQDGSLYAPMVAGRVRGYARVWRPDGYSIKVRFPLRLLSDRKIDLYRWQAHVYESTGGPCANASDCSDVVPDRGFIRHDLRTWVRCSEGKRRISNLEATKVDCSTARWVARRYDEKLLSSGHWPSDRMAIGRFSCRTRSTGPETYRVTCVRETSEIVRFEWGV